MVKYQILQDTESGNDVIFIFLFDRRDAQIMQHCEVEVNVPHVFIQIRTQPVNERPSNRPAMTVFHSPVGAVISAYVWRKLARYTGNIQITRTEEYKCARL